jgi:hypothetical protein
VKNLKFFVGVAILVGLFVILIVVNPKMIKEYREQEQFKQDAQYDWVMVMSALKSTDVKLEVISLGAVRTYNARSQDKDYYVLCDGKDELGYCRVFEFVAGGFSPIKK